MRHFAPFFCINFQAQASFIILLIQTTAVGLKRYLSRKDNRNFVEEKLLKNSPTLTKPMACWSRFKIATSIVRVKDILAFNCGNCHKQNLEYRYYTKLK